MGDNWILLWAILICWSESPNIILIFPIQLHIIYLFSFPIKISLLILHIPQLKPMNPKFGTLLPIVLICLLLGIQQYKIVEGITCFAGQQGTSFYARYRQYECSAEFDYCYIAYCKYDHWLYSGYDRMGCANRDFCSKNQTTWRDICAQTKGDTFYNYAFKGVGFCKTCHGKLCNQPY